MIYFLCKAITENVKLSFEHTEFAWSTLENISEKLNTPEQSLPAIYKQFFLK